MLQDSRVQPQREEPFKILVLPRLDLLSLGYRMEGRKEKKNSQKVITHKWVNGVAITYLQTY